MQGAVRDEAGSGGRGRPRCGRCARRRPPAGPRAAPRPRARRAAPAAAGSRRAGPAPARPRGPRRRRAGAARARPRRPGRRCARANERGTACTIVSRPPIRAAQAAASATTGASSGRSAHRRDDAGCPVLAGPARAPRAAASAPGRRAGRRPPPRTARSRRATAAPSPSVVHHRVAQSGTPALSVPSVSPPSGTTTRTRDACRRGTGRRSAAGDRVRVDMSTPGLGFPGRCGDRTWGGPDMCRRSDLWVRDAVLPRRRSVCSTRSAHRAAHLVNLITDHPNVPVWQRLRARSVAVRSPTRRAGHRAGWR